MLYNTYCSITPNFLSREDIDYIHGYASKLETIDARIGFKSKDEDAAGNTDGNTDNKIRQSTNKWLDHNDPEFNQELKKKIFDGMMAANQMSGWNYDINDMETWQYTYYKHQPDLPTGDFYTWHTDAGADPYPNGQIRKLSASIQLSDPDDYEGGHFQWIEHCKPFDNLKFQSQDISADDLVQTAPFSGKELGSLLVFPSWLHHQVTPVTRGVRQSLVIWNTGWPLK